jgi:hypothetical protein
MYQGDLIVIARMIAFRQIEIERDTKKVAGPPGPPEEQRETPETTDTSKFWKLPDKVKRSQIRFERKVQRVQVLNISGRGGGRKTVQQQEEASRWAQKKDELYQKVDKQYNVEINLKGMFK